MSKQDLERREGVCPKVGDVLAEVLAESPMNICFTLMWYFRIEVPRWKKKKLSTVHNTVQYWGCFVYREG